MTQNSIEDIMNRIPAVARLYHQRGYRRASVLPGPGEPLVLQSHAEQEIIKLLTRINQLEAADHKDCEKANEQL